MTEYDDSLEEVIRWTKINLRSYRGHAKYEDALQEASIRAWKDMESGKYSFLHVVRRAAIWGRSFLQKDHSRTTGSPPLSRDSISTGKSDAQMWAIDEYRQEYFKTHGKFPRNTDVGKMFEMSSTDVDRQVQRRRDGKWDHARYVNNADGTRSIHPDYSTPTHIEAMKDTLGGTDSKSPYEFLFPDEAPGPEELVLNLDFYNLLSEVSETNREVLYMFCVLGYNTTEIGRACGYERNLNQNGYKRLKRAKTEAEKYLTVTP